MIVPNQGYWKKNETSNLIIHCPNEEACLGSFTILEYATITGNCSEGYQGFLCNIC